MFIVSSRALAMPSLPSPRPPGAGSRDVPSQVGRQPIGWGVLCSGAYYAGRVKGAEALVRSSFLTSYAFKTLLTAKCATSCRS